MEERFIVKKYQKAENGYPKIIVDKETGVNYFYFTLGTTGGLTPLLDKEGKPVVTPVN